MINKFMITEMISKPFLSGLSAFALTRFATYGLNPYGQNFTMPFNTIIPGLSRFNDSRINLPILTGLAVGMASLGSDLITSQVFAFLSSDEVMQNCLSGAFQMTSVSAGAAFTHYAVNNNSLGDRGVLNIIGVSVASEAIGSFTYNRFIRPMIRDSEEEYLL